MPLTDEQRNALSAIRAMSKDLLIPIGTAESSDKRARLPAPGIIPSDVSIHVEIAPPSPHPHPLLLDTGTLKTPERVPVFFFALRSDRSAEPVSDSDSDLDVADAHVIFHIHGGGNVIMHPTDEQLVQYYVQLLRAVASHSGDAAKTKCVLVAPSYRLATIPENTFPAALQDIVAAYDYTLGKGYKTSNIVIAGDSAGGNHAIVLTHLILQSDRPSPRGVVSIAPMAIQAFDRLSEHAKAQADNDIMGVSTVEAMSTLYVGDSVIDRRDPLVSGAFVPFTASWPKTLILVGTSDQLIDASRELEKRLLAVGRPVELVEYDERPHGWWIMADLFPENIQDSVQRIAQFLLH